MRQTEKKLMYVTVFRSKMLPSCHQPAAERAELKCVAVALRPNPLLHDGTENLGRGKQTEGKESRLFILSISLSFFSSFSQKDKGLCSVTFIIFIQIMANSKSSRTINS